MSEINFKYHPDPLKTGAFEKRKAVVCECCGRATDVRYDGWFYAAKKVNDLCPECIASGEAARKFDGVFQQDFNVDEVSDPEKLDELLHRTPGSLAHEGYWPAHCGDYCAYVGASNCKELEQRGLLEEIHETFREDILALDFEDFVHDFESDGVHLYKCLHCGKLIAMIEYD